MDSFDSSEPRPDEADSDKDSIEVSALPSVPLPKSQRLRHEDAIVDSARWQQTPVYTNAAPLGVDPSGLHFSSLASYLEIPFIHKWLIVLCTFLGVAAGWGAIKVWPRSYESSAKLMIRVGRESVSLDPTATTSATLMLQKTQEEEIISALEVLNSRQVAESIVDTIGVDPILSGQLPDPEGENSADPSIAKKIKSLISDGIFHTLKFAGLKDDISNRELADHEKCKANCGCIHRESPTSSSSKVRESRLSWFRRSSSRPPRLFSACTSRALTPSGSFEFFETQAKIGRERT